jgi:beta-lactamase regulating signal transducer with metallopeptidase domain
MTGLVIEAALRSLLLALAVWAGLRVFRVRNVLAEKAAWILVLAAAVAMPVLLMLAAQWPILPAPRLVLPAMVTQRPAAPRAPLAGTAAAGPQVLLQAPLPPAPARPQEDAVGRYTANGASAQISSAGGLPPRFLSKTMDPARLSPAEMDPARMGAAESAPDKSSSARPISFALGAAVLYLLIAGVLCLRLILGLAATLRVWRAAQPVPALGLDSAEGLPLRASDRITAPVTLGSGVLLPAEYSAWGEEKLRIVLAHERSHVRQCDSYLQLLASLYAALLWWSPLGWWLKRKLSDLGEAIGDRSGLKEAQSRTSYARVLLEFASTPRPTLLGVAMARPSSLSRRMERLLNESAFRQAFSSHRRAFAAALLLPAIFISAAALVRVEAAGDSAGQAATEAAQAKAHRIASAQKAAEARAEAAQELAEAQEQTANAQEVSADKVEREAEAAQELTQAQEQRANAQEAVQAQAASAAQAQAAMAQAEAQAQIAAAAQANAESAADGASNAVSQASGPGGEMVALLAGRGARGQSSDAAVEATFDRTLSYSGNLDLHAATGCGNIHLTRGAAGQLVVHGHVHSSEAEEADQVHAIAANPPIEQEGNIIRIGKQHNEEQQSEERHNHICIDYEIQAPAEAALEATSGSGDIVDEGVGHGAKLMTGSGNITATGLEGGFTSQTGSGDIAIENAGEGDAKAQTGSGNIDVKAVHGAFKAQTGSGDIKASGTPSSAWKLQTGSGTVEFSPGSAGLTLDASTGSGSITTDHPMALEVSSDHHRMTGQLNGGGPDVRIQTGSGDIRIHD